jgi:hypothetical protein
MKKGRMPLFSTLFFDWIHQQRRVFTHPRGPQVERRRHGTLVTGEVAVAALLITPAFTGAADVDDAPAKPIAMVAYQSHLKDLGAERNVCKSVLGSGIVNCPFALN